MTELVISGGAWVSPRFGGGSGLKHDRPPSDRLDGHVSPRFGGGSGLKQLT